MVDRLIQYQLALFGQPVKHSQSPRIHQAFAAQFGLNIDYELIEASTEDFTQQLHDFMREGHGANITVPHKQLAHQTVDRLTERAQAAAAVNTVYWRDGDLWGDNTDGDGLVLDLQSKGIELNDMAVLIIGAGGATQGIIPSLLDQGVTEIAIKNRNKEKASWLSDQFEKCHVAGLKTSCDFDLIIHATSMGHQGLSPELKEYWFCDETIAYDLSYGDAAQPFLEAARVCGAKQTFDGLGMLYGQAALAFERWFGQRPEIVLPAE